MDIFWGANVKKWTHRMDMMNACVYFARGRDLRLPGNPGGPPQRGEPLNSEGTWALQADAS